MERRMDRTKIIIATQENIEKMDDLYWASASVKEKVETVTFLRECFYGKEATTGRLQRFCTIIKYKWCGIFADWRAAGRDQDITDANKLEKLMKIIKEE